MKATQKAYQEKMEMSTLKLEKEWEKKLKNVLDMQSSDLNTALALAKNNSDLELFSSEKKNKLEIDKLKNSLAEIIKLKDNEKIIATAENVRVLTELEDEKLDHINDVNKLNKKGKEEKEEAEEKLRNELENLRNLMTSDFSERERVSTEGYDNVIQMMREAAEKAEGKTKILLHICFTQSFFDLLL